MQNIEREYTNRLDSQILQVRDCMYKNLFEKSLNEFEIQTPRLKPKGGKFSNRPPTVLKVNSSKDDIMRIKTSSHCFQKLSVNFKNNAHPFSEVLSQIEFKRHIPIHQFQKQEWFSVD